MAAPADWAWIIECAKEEGVLDLARASKWSTAFALKAKKEAKEHREGLRYFLRMQDSIRSAVIVPPILLWLLRQSLTSVRAFLLLGRCLPYRLYRVITVQL
jgi:hypothetical protein